MRISVFARRVSAARRPTTRVLLAVGACLTGGVLFTGCEAANAPANHQTGLRLSADSSLLAPVASTTYSIYTTESLSDDEGVPPEPLNAPKRHSGAEPATQGNYSPDLGEALGTFVVSDGLITSIDLVASVASSADLHFVLTEPAVFERRGIPLDTVVTIGTLSTAYASYPETRVLLTPVFTSDSNTIQAQFEIPESLTADSSTTLTPVSLTLSVEPLATFEGQTAQHSDELLDVQAGR